jgi:hypothetical protein
VDHYHRALVKLKKTNYKSYLNYFLSPLVKGREYFENSGHNFMQFLKRDFHDDAGIKFLIESFYRSITNDASLPISYREILLTSKIMDAIFEQIYPQKSDITHLEELSESRL